ncbi:OmpH family outer membrane protein [Oscillatoria laete-virens NRMC-F 0139]|nr:OmpH family outer membrane protein [Oscillatoria laete-virens]MDL5054470.1 OmpH family outer membrane protein [Oscillatoria laete-virens NRMC-F 0139]
MKTKNLIIAGIVSMTLLGSGLSINAQTAPVPATGAKPSPRIALVDMDKCLNAYNKRKDAEKTLQAALENYQKDRQDMEATVQKLQDEGRRIQEDLNNPALDEKTKEARRKEVQDKGVEFQMKMQQYQEMRVSRERQLAEQRARLMEQMYNEIADAAGKKAQQLGYNLVIDKRKGGFVVFDASGCDISDDVIAALNAPSATSAPKK